MPSNNPINDEKIPLNLSFSQNESPYVSTFMQNVGNQVISSEQSENTDIRLLSEKWWSSFNLLKHRCLHRLLLLPSLLTMVSHPYIIHDQCFVQKCELMKLLVIIHAFLVSIVIFIASLVLIWGKRFIELFENLYQKSFEISTNDTNESNNNASIGGQCSSTIHPRTSTAPRTRPSLITKRWSSFKFALSNIHYSWPFVIMISAYFSLVVPLIHPDFGKKWFEFLFPGLFPSFFSNCIRYFFIQQFWISCYILRTKCESFKNIIQLQNKQNISQSNNSELRRDNLFAESEADRRTKQIALLRNLEQIKESYKDLLDITQYADDRFKVLIAFFISAAILGTYIPINQLYQLTISHELTEHYVISLLIIISTSILVLGYSLYTSLCIPEVSNSALISYKRTVAAQKIEYLSDDFNRAFEMAEHRLFNELPNFTFAGFFRLNATFLSIAFIFQFIPLLITILDWIPYHRPDN